MIGSSLAAQMSNMTDSIPIGMQKAMLAHTQYVVISIIKQPYIIT